MSSAPPPLKTLPKGKLAALAQLTSNDAAVQKLKSEATASTFFDRHSPAVRKRRETTRAEFELIMSSIFPSEPLWDLSTITEKTKIYLSTVIQIAKGRIDQLPRTDLLYQRKEAIYWWAMRMIPKFPTVLVNWQMLTNAHIGYLGVTMGLSREHRKKRNLTDAELEVLFEGVMSKTSSTANLKQHYLAWLLIWTCSARPGSFTVCPGYEEGSDLGTGMNRMEDETLRWSDVEFMRVDDAVCVQINFRYTKGQRNPYTKKISFGAKKFTFLPCTGNRYHLDLSTVITAVALERGLFHPIRSWSELRATELFVITKDAKVNRQAVFLASDVGRNQLLPEKPMREAALNPVLKAISTDVGLWERNTTYSLRRTAIVETRRLEGTEFAQQLAGHIPGSTTIYAYDDSPLSDVDMTALRLGEQGMSREDIRKTFSQMNTARIDNTAGLRAELKEFVEAEMRAHERYIHAEKLLDDSLVELRGHLSTDELTIEDTLSLDPLDEKFPMLKEALEVALAARKETRKQLRREFTDIFKAQKLEEHKKALKFIKSGSSATHKHGALSAEARDEHSATVVGGNQLIDESAESVVQAIEGLKAPEPEQEVADDVDIDAINGGGACEDVRQEPTSWKALDDKDSVGIEGDAGMALGLTGDSGREAFITRFMGHVDLQVKGMTCLLCQLDETVPQAQKDLQWHRKAELDRHIRSQYHTEAATRKRCID